MGCRGEIVRRLEFVINLSKLRPRVSVMLFPHWGCFELKSPPITKFLLREENKSFKMISLIGFAGGKYAATMVVFVLLMFNWMFALCIDWLAVGGLILYLILLRIKIAAPP